MNRFYELPTELQDAIYLTNDLSEHKEKMESVFDAINCVGKMFNDCDGETTTEADWIDRDLWGYFWDDMEEYQDAHYVIRKNADWWLVEWGIEMYQVHLSIKSLGELKNEWLPFVYE